MSYDGNSEIMRNIDSNINKKKESPNEPTSTSFDSNANESISTEFDRRRLLCAAQLCCVLE